MTMAPILFALGAAFIFIFVAALFLIYDLLVRREFNAKQQLLEAKRHFMRFVSHEVRTPLNAVCLGLSVL
jgi:signal transduction histidine kinase